MDCQSADAVNRFIMILVNFSLCATSRYKCIFLKLTVFIQVYSEILVHVQHGLMMIQIRKNMMFCLEVPVLVTTNTAGDIPRSQLKHPGYKHPVVWHLQMSKLLSLAWQPSCMKFYLHQLHFPKQKSGHKHVTWKAYGMFCRKVTMVCSLWHKQM